MSTIDPIMEHLRQVADENGYTLKGISKASGVSNTCAEYALKGKTIPSLEKARAMANAMGFHLALVEMTEEEKKAHAAGVIRHIYVARQQ